MATFDDFKKLDIRVGKIIQVDEFPEAKQPAYKLKIDFGKFGVKNSSAQITKLYTKKDLMGRQVVAVVNFPPKQIANVISDVLVLGAMKENGEVILLMPDREAQIGSRIA